MFNVLELELMTQEYSVLLTDAKRTSYGSGVIYYPGSGTRFYIFTCAHVIDDLLDPIQIYMLLPNNRDIEDYHVCRVEVNKSQIVYASTDEVTEEHGQRIHTVDAAVICVVKDPRMTLEKTNYYIAEARKTDKVLVQGYPGGMQVDCALLDSLDTMCGAVLHYAPGTLTFTIRTEDSFLDTGNRTYELKGFSGSPVWNDSNEVLSLFGLVSEGVGENVYRGRIKAVKLHSIRSIMQYKFNIHLETRVVGIPETDVAGSDNVFKFNGRIEIADHTVYDEWLNNQTDKVREYIDEIQFQKAIDTAKDTIKDAKFENCSDDKKKHHMQHLLYCYESCLLEDEYIELEKEMNRRKLLDGHDSLSWMTLNFGKRKFEIVQKFAEEVLKESTANKVVLIMAQVFSTICKGYTENAPVQNTILQFLDDNENLKLTDIDADTAALVYQMLGYTYENCYREAVKAVRCLNRAYRIGHDNAVLESVGAAYYFLSLKGAVREDDTVIHDKLDRASLYKARTCYLLILQKADDLYRRAMFKREGMVIFNTFFFLNEPYRILTLYKQIRECLPELQDKDYRDIEMKYAKICCYGGPIELSQFSYLRDEDKKLLDVLGKNSVVLRKLDAFPFICHPGFQNELFETIRYAEDGLSGIDERERISIRSDLINLYGWGHKLFQWNVAENIKKHISQIEDEKVVKTFENFLLENTGNIEEAEVDFIKTWEENPCFIYWQEVLQFYKRNALFDLKMLDKADIWFKGLFADHFDYIKDEPEYAYRAYIDYVTHYRRDIKDAIEVYLSHKDEMHDKNISEFFKWELRMYTNCFNNPEEFDEERKLFVEDGLLPEEEYHRTSLIGYMENLDAENAWKHFHICNRAFGAIQDMDEPLLTSEGAHFLVWQRKFHGHKESKWCGMSNCQIEKVLERLSSEDWHDDVNEIKKRNQYDVYKNIAIDAWSLFLLANQNRLDDLECFDTVYVTHVSVNRLMEELCHYENEYIRSVLDYIHYMDNAQIISADLDEQLVVREKTSYDEPGTTIAVAIAKNCLVVVSEPNITESTISAFRSNIVSVVDFDKLL
jgi:hypothetical protein